MVIGVENGDVLGLTICPDKVHKPMDNMWQLKSTLNPTLQGPPP